MGQLVVVVPLRGGAATEARALLRQGPPVEPEKGGLHRYAAFVTMREAVLVLEGPGIQAGNGTPWLDVASWKDGPRWEGCVGAPPRLAENIDTWQRVPELTGVFFGPLPGPGDSEGGGVGVT